MPTHGYAAWRDARVRTVDDLMQPFFEAHKARSQWRVGTESEKFGIEGQEHTPISFSGPRGAQQILRDLAARYGWQEERETAQGELLALRRDDASITLEPGSQLELSGAPKDSIHATAAEVEQHQRELKAVSEPLDIRWLGLGFHPFAKQEQLSWVPKLRYRVMREYLPTRGSMALDMMRRTCTVQANLDFDSEADAMCKLRLSLKLQPLVTAMFGNSPWEEGSASRDQVRRARVWLNMDPDRSGLLPFAWNEGATYHDYVRWAMQAPMFLIRRGDQIIANTGQPFGDFMQRGFEGHEATGGDWETHLNTLFPEVRLKKTLEVRGADGQSAQLIPALPALWKGLLYNDNAQAKAEALAEPIALDAMPELREAIARGGLQTNYQHKPLSDWALRLLNIATEGLEQLGCLNEQGEDESIYLEPLRKRLEQGQSPAHHLLAQIDPTQPLATQIVKVAAF